MSDLVRFGVAMDRALLSEFDRRIAARGYENRSEALRDLVRADLTRAAWESGASVAATLTLVYDRHVREMLARIAETPHEGAPDVVSSVHVHLDAARCLEVLILRGRAADLGALAGRLGGARGVLACELTLASELEGPTRAAPPARQGRP